MNLQMVSWYFGGNVMDKFDFISMVDDIFDECKTKEEMSSKLEQMREILRQEYTLKLGFKSIMGEI